MKKQLEQKETFDEPSTPQGNNYKNQPMHFLQVLALALILTTVVALSGGFMTRTGDPKVYASSDLNPPVVLGMHGMTKGILGMPIHGSRVDRIGPSFEKVMVGQRVKVLDSESSALEIDSYVDNRLDSICQVAAKMSASPKIMSDEDYYNFLRIVEAEAGTEDELGRILVANVIMNRIAYPDFPDTVTEVVFQYDKSGVPQFSPVYDGSIYGVTISDLTIQAVNKVISGMEDQSRGALFFIQRDAAEKNNVTWFDKNLVYLLKHGVHEFYKYPDDVSENA